MERPNRFVARVTVQGREVLAHVPNSGRLEELLHPDNLMLLAPANQRDGRKTAYDLLLVSLDDVLVSADARLPNALLAEAIRRGRLAEFAGYDEVRTEVTFEDSRLDLALSRPDGLCYIEAKSVTLVSDGVALFPDAPTERGRKHLGTLARAVEQGHRAAVVFVVQRPDARRFAPNTAADPEFCERLAAVAAAGVEVHVFRCTVTREEIVLANPLPVSWLPGNEALVR